MQKILLFTCLFFLATSNSQSQNVPQGFNYQCIVRDVMGVPLADSTVTLFFEIHSESENGPVVYSETHTSATNEFGLLNLVIGQGDMPQGNFGDINWGQSDKFLTIKLGNDPLGVVQLLSVPYALYAENAKNGDNWGTQAVSTGTALTGNGTATNPLDFAQQGATPGHVLKWNGNAWSPAPDNDTGDDWGTQIAQTISPLTGNGSTTPLTIQNESIASTHIQNGAIQTDDLADGAVTAAKLNSMGADTNQLLQWNGASWIPTDKPPSFWGANCDDGTKILALDDRVLGLGGCPHDSVFFHVKNNQQKRIGAQFDVEWGENETRPATGLKVNVSGSGVNDGIILFARNANNISRGMTINALNDTTFTTDTTQALLLSASNGIKKNDALVAEAWKGDSATGITVRAHDAKVNRGLVVSAGNSANTDFALYASVDGKIQDWAGYFNGNINVDGRLQLTNSQNNKWQIYAHDQVSVNLPNGCDNYPTNPSNTLILAYQNNIKGLFKTDGGYCTISDIRLKDQILPLSPVLAQLSQIKAYSYIFKNDPSQKRSIGFMAQEIEDSFPELVERLEKPEGGDLYTVNYSAFSVIAIKAIQEQQAVIETQQAQLNKLEKEMAELKALLKLATIENTGIGSKK